MVASPENPVTHLGAVVVSILGEFGSTPIRFQISSQPAFIIGNHLVWSICFFIWADTRPSFPSRDFYISTTRCGEPVTGLRPSVNFAPLDRERRIAIVSYCINVFTRINGTKQKPTHTGMLSPISLPSVKIPKPYYPTRAFLKIKNATKWAVNQVLNRPRKMK